MDSAPSARALVAAISASPGDDAAALVYADWLEEHGDSARAAFIRAQIERESRSPFDARSVHLELQEEVLLAAHDQRWRAELPALPKSGYCEIAGFRRGVMLDVFVEERLEPLQDFAAATRAIAPVASVDYSYLDIASAKKRQNAAPIESLRELRLWGLDRFADLVELPLLSTLTRLALDGRYLESGDAELLMSAPHASKLSSLRLEDILVGNELLFAIAEADHPSLTALELPVRSRSQMPSAGEFDVIDLEGIEALCSWPGLTRVETLDLSGHALGTAGLRALLASPNATGLRRLEIRSVGDAPDLLSAFGDAHPDLRLQELVIGDRALDDAGAEVLAEARCLRDLECLRVVSLEPSAQAWERLTQAPWFAQLRVLEISNSPAAALMRALCARMPDTLHTLRLHRCFGRLSPEESLAELLRSSAADGLLSLDCDIAAWPSPIGSALLGGSLRGLLRLQIDIAGRNVSPDAALLVQSPLGQRLISLTINSHQHKPRLSPHLPGQPEEGAEQ